MTREQAVPRLLGHDAHRQPVRRVGARVAVLDEDFLAAQIGEHAALEAVECRRIDRAVHLAPRDVLLARGFLDDELVVGRAAGVLAGAADDRPISRNLSFTPPHDFLVERRGSEAPVHARAALDPDRFQPDLLLDQCHYAVPPTRLTKHTILLRNLRPPDTHIMSTRANRARTWAIALAAAGLLVAAACQPPQLPEPTVRLPEFVQVRAAGHIESVGLEDYVLGSVLAEVSPLNQPPAAVARIFEVQAVLARTYVAGNLGKHRTDGFDVCDTTHCQLYDPARERTSRFADAARQAVRRTAGLVLTYQGRLAEGLYHADCGGYTASAEEVWGGERVPYLIAAPDDVATIQHRQWRWVVSPNDLRAALNASSRAEVGRTLDRVDVIEHDPGGHAARVAVVGEHTHELRGEEFRYDRRPDARPAGDPEHALHNYPRQIGHRLYRRRIRARRRPLPGRRGRARAPRGRSAGDRLPLLPWSSTDKRMSSTYNSVQ